MHELPFVESLLALTLKYAAQAQAKRVLALNLVIGQMSSLVDDSVQFYWEQLARGTIAEGAELRFTRVPAEFYCWDCGTTYTLDASHLTCPQCGGHHVSLVKGDELRLESIEVE